MARFGVGDKVVIMGYVHDRGEHYSFVPEMDEYIGKVARVMRVTEQGNCIRLNVDSGRYSWHRSWLAYPKGRVDIYEC